VCGDRKMFAVCGRLSPFVGMAGASGPDLGLAPYLQTCAWIRAVPATLEVGFGTDGASTCAVQPHVGRQRSRLREGGYERGVAADDCFSRAGVTSRTVKTPAYQRHSGHIAPCRASAAARIRPKQQRSGHQVTGRALNRTPSSRLRGCLELG
jgi:hypothetical protein